MSEPLLRALWPGCGPRSSTTRRWSGRSRPAASAARSRRGAASSSGTSTSRRAATSRSRRTTTRRRTPRNHAVGDAARDGGRRPARPAVRQLARRHGDRDPPAPGHQEGRGRRAHARATGRPGRADPRPRPRQGPAARRGRPGLPGAGSQRPRGPDEAEPAEQVPPGRGVPPDPRRLDRRRPRQGPPARPTPERPLRDRRPRLRQRLPDLRHRALPHPRARAAGAPDRHRPARAVARAQRADRPRARRRRDLRRRVHRGRRARRDRPTWCSRCTPATPPPTTRSRGPSSGRRRWSWPRRAATTTSPPSSARRPRPRRTRCSPGTASCASGSPTPSPTACAPRCCGSQGYRVDVMQFVGSEHTPRNTLLRAVRTGTPVIGRLRPPGVRRAGGDLGGPAAAGRAAWMPSRSGRSAGRGAVRGRAAAVTPDAPHGTTAFSFQDPAIVEASALVVQDGLFLTTNDSGDTRPRLRRRRDRATRSGVTHWSDDPTDVEALAPAGPGSVWVGDIGDNLASRPDVTITRVPVGRGDRTVQPTSYRLTYPRRRDRRRDPDPQPGHRAALPRHQERLRRHRCTPYRGT